MKKTLYDLTKDDWNTLFPIELSEHNTNWKKVFEAEKTNILNNVNNAYFKNIEHFGSTSIPNIKAKAYIDLFIEIPSELLFDKDLIRSFENIGYTYFEVPARENIEAYMSFGKGYNLEGKKRANLSYSYVPK